MSVEPYITGKIAVFNLAKIAAKERGANGKAFFMTALHFREIEEIYRRTNAALTAI